MLVTHSEHFTEQELMCRCGCGDAGMHDWFMETLEEIRGKLGTKMPVTSGYRCPEYNEQVSKTGKTGPHTHRCAVDVRIYGTNAYRLIRIALSHGIIGIGIQQKGPYHNRFIHLDMLTTEAKRPWVWTY